MAGLNLFQLRCFIAVAEYLNFARAAEVMCVTQPAVTHQIRGLEEEVGVRLLNRSTHSVTLTADGALFLEDARKIVKDCETALGRFSDENEIQEIRIGCPFPAQVLRMAPIVRRMRKDNPNLHPDLQVISPSRILGQVMNDNIDAAVDIREMHQDKKGLHFKKIGDCPVVCVCAKDHPLAERKGITVSELKKEAVIQFRTSYTISDLSQLQWTISEHKGNSELYSCGSIEAAVSLASAGYGITVFPSVVIPDSPLIQRIPITDGPNLSFGIYYRTAGPLLRQFLELAESNRGQVRT